MPSHNRTNTIESFWAIVKRAFVGQFHAVSRKFRFISASLPTATICGTAGAILTACCILRSSLKAVRKLTKSIGRQLAFSYGLTRQKLLSVTQMVAWRPLLQRYESRSTQGCCGRSLSRRAKRL